MSEETYMKSYTSFSGADMVPTLNGQVIGEVYEVKFEENLVNPEDIWYPITGYVDVCIFDKDTFRQTLLPVNNEFVLSAANEYGQSMMIDFNSIIFLKREGGIAVDNAMMMERYSFKAKEVLYKNGVPLVKEAEPSLARDEFEAIQAIVEETITVTNKEEVQ